uniref:G-protein coupled receptors family 1 profile domain-containing protein n=1 Tax=Ditylenchus dipsaci TaxID=166011 RepID=A0A915D6G1_9BILA
MDVYFVHPELYAQRYNCSELTAEQWQNVGEKRVFFGVVTILTGIVFQCVYTPFIVAMLQPRFYLISCYKLMLFLGIMDLFSILVGCIITGYLLVVGAVFCTHPTLIYFTGVINI